MSRKRDPTMSREWCRVRSFCATWGAKALQSSDMNDSLAGADPSVVSVGLLHLWAALLVMTSGRRDAL